MGHLYYETDVFVGTPAQKVGSVVFDTGSGQMWLPGKNSTDCVQGNCGTGASFSVSSSSTWKYTGQGEGWGGNGIIGSDSFSFAGQTLDNLQIWVSLDTMSDNLGIFGQGPVLDPSIAAASFVEGLAKSGKISRAVFSLNSEQAINTHEDATSWDHTVTNVYYGGFDTKKYQGPLTTVDMDPITGTYFPVGLSGMNVDGSKVEFSRPHSLILDTGGITLELTNGTLALLCSKHGGRYDNVGWSIDCNAKPVLSYVFGETEIPVEMEFFIKKDDNGVCRLPDITVAPDDQESLLTGPPMISRALIIFDTSRKQVSLAKAKFTTESNVVEITGDIPGAVLLN